MKLRLFNPVVLSVLAAALIMIGILFVPPVVGVADNGDFLRIMRTIGLDYVNPAMDATDKYFNYFISVYADKSFGIGGYISTELLIGGAAVLLDRLLTWNGTFDIRFLAFLYSALLLWAMYLTMKSGERFGKTSQWILGVLLVLVFCDGGYISYFNSLYGEPVSFTFLLLTVALALTILSKEKPGKRWLILFFVAAAFFAGAKVQNAPSGLPLALLGIRFASMRTDRSWRRTALWGSVLLVAFSAAIYLLDPKEIKIINQYQTVFYGVLKDSPHPEKDLEELGIKPEFAVLKDTNFFTPDTPIKQNDPILQKEVYDKVDQLDVAWFYLTHPSRFLDKLEVSSANAYIIKPSYLGNYEKIDNVPPGKLSTGFTWWSEFKKTKLPHSFLWTAIFFLAYFAVLIFKRVKSDTIAGRIRLEMYLIIGLLAMLHFVVPVVGSGEADLAKHLFLYDVCFDIMFVASAVWVLRLVFWNQLQKPVE